MMLKIIWLAPSVSPVPPYMENLPTDNKPFTCQSGSQKGVLVLKEILNENSLRILDVLGRCYSLPGSPHFIDLHFEDVEFLGG